MKKPDIAKLRKFLGGGDAKLTADDMRTVSEAILYLFGMSGSGDIEVSFPPGNPIIRYARAVGNAGGSRAIMRVTQNSTPSALSGIEVVWDTDTSEWATKTGGRQWGDPSISPNLGYVYASQDDGGYLGSVVEVLLSESDDGGTQWVSVETPRPKSLFYDETSQTLYAWTVAGTDIGSAASKMRGPTMRSVSVPVNTGANIHAAYDSINDTFDLILVSGALSTPAPSPYEGSQLLGVIQTDASGTLILLNDYASYPSAVGGGSNRSMFTPAYISRVGYTGTGLEVSAPGGGTIELDIRDGRIMDVTASP